jgi:hypothetical protein
MCKGARLQSCRNPLRRRENGALAPCLQIPDLLHATPLPAAWEGPSNSQGSDSKNKRRTLNQWWTTLHTQPPCRLRQDRNRNLRLNRSARSSYRIPLSRRSRRIRFMHPIAAARLHRHCRRAAFVRTLALAAGVAHARRKSPRHQHHRQQSRPTTPHTGIIGGKHLHYEKLEESMISGAAGCYMSGFSNMGK